MTTDDGEYAWKEFVFITHFWDKNQWFSKQKSWNHPVELKWTVKAIGRNFDKKSLLEFDWLYQNDQ